jgi:hypothetical protein
LLSNVNYRLVKRLLSAVEYGSAREGYARGYDSE